MRFEKFCEKCQLNRLVRVFPGSFHHYKYTCNSSGMLNYLAIKSKKSNSSERLRLHHITCSIINRDGFSSYKSNKKEFYQEIQSEYANIGIELEYRRLFSCEQAETLKIANSVPHTIRNKNIMCSFRLVSFGLCVRCSSFKIQC